MRPDMSKVIVERPRLGRFAPRRPRLMGAALLDAPMQESMRRAHRTPKELNENLAPLRRYLDSRVGKYWPKVHADVCENLRPTSTVQQHVRDHLHEMVATSTVMKDGAIWVHGGRLRVCRLEEAGCEFYVHPVSNCLMRHRHHRSWRKVYPARQARLAAELAARRRDLAPDRQLHKLRGCWFEVTLAPLGKRRQAFVKPHSDETRLGAGTLHDVVIPAGLSDLPPEELYGRADVFAVAKRQLGRRELQANGLRND